MKKDALPLPPFPVESAHAPTCRAHPQASSDLSSTLSGALPRRLDHPNCLDHYGAGATALGEDLTVHRAGEITGLQGIAKNKQANIGFDTAGNEPSRAWAFLLPFLESSSRAP